MESYKLSIVDILKAKESRSEYQKQLIKEYNNTLISFKLNIPGEVKDGQLYRQIFEEGFIELIEVLKRKGLKIVFKNKIYIKSGAEAYVIVNEKPKKTKELTIEIEETHPLGRIFDYDIFDGKNNQISRADVGKRHRKCFICNENAFVCGRNQKHYLEDLIKMINKKAEEYFKNKY